MSEPVPFPFVVGCGRSGTTLLRVMFDSHPQMAVPLEAYFPTEVPEGAMRQDGSFDARRAAELLDAKWWLPRWNLEPGAFVAAASSPEVATYADVIRCLFRLYADAQHKPRYGNKTPKHVLLIPELADLFPEARFIHIVRDGRDVALSVLDVDLGPGDMAAAARFWRDRVEQGRASGRALGEDRYCEVPYEALLEDAEGELRRLCAFVDLPFDEGMLRYHERGVLAVTGVRVPDKHRHLAEPPTKGLRDWRTQMSRNDVALFEALAGPTLDVLGYERSGVRSTPGDRVLNRWRQVVSDIRERTRMFRRKRRFAAARRSDA